MNNSLHGEIVIRNHWCPAKNYFVPNGTSIDFYLPFYQHTVPNGTVPEGLNIGRIKRIPPD